MENGAQTPEHRTPFLLQRVVAPNWLQVIILATLGYVFVKLFITNPLLLVAGIILNVLILAYVRRPLRWVAGQGTDEDDKAEVAAAPTLGKAAKISWLKLRTYQVWHLVILVLATAGVLLDVAGIPMP